MPKKKLIAFDVDGTLAQSKLPIENKMAHLLLNLLNKKRVAFISGASYTHMLFQMDLLIRLLEENKKNQKNVVFLPTSGSQCYQYDKKVDEFVLSYKSEFPSELKETVIKALNHVMNSPGLEITKEPIGNQIDDRGTQIAFAVLGKDVPLETKIIWDPDRDKRQKIKLELDKMLDGQATVTIAGTSTIDILPANFTKATGLSLFISHNKLEKDDLIFVGDAIYIGGNDYPVKEAGIETIKVSGPDETASLIEGWL